MNLRQLRYFCEVVDSGSARAAAEKLFVAPTAISMQLGLLESELGAPLLDRASRPMSLTALGQFVYPKAKELLGQADRLKADAEAMAKGKFGWLGIGFTRSAIYSIVPEAVRKMQSSVPDVKLDLIEVLSEEQGGALRSGVIHVGIARTLGEISRQSDLDYIDLFDDRLVAVLSASHRLATRKSIKARELQSVKFISYPPVAASQYSRQVLAVLEQEGAAPVVGHEAKEVHTALGLAAAGMGFTVVGQSVSSHNRDDVRFIPISDVRVRSRVYAVRRRGSPNALVDAFIRIVQESSRSPNW